MSKMDRMHELLALKTIAETLNMSNDMQQMLDAVLHKLLEVTGLTTGWVFLAEEETEYVCAADDNLPPALAWEEKTPMCSGSCWCLNRYWKGQLNHAVNIIECKRIEDAMTYNWGDTKGIVHHATVPLKAGDEMFGVLNVASPGKDYFTEEELALLQAVAFQIGTALKRTKLYYAQQKRAENYAKFSEVSHRLGSLLDHDNIPSEVVRQIGEIFGWPTAAFFVREGLELSLRALFEKGRVRKVWKAIPLQKAGLIRRALSDRLAVKEERVKRRQPALESIGLPPFRSAAAVPIRLRDEPYGVLYLASDRINQFDEHDLAVLNALGDQIALTIENARLYTQRKELTRREERNRLARDLHDSVSQNLFSLTLTARGAEALLDHKDTAARTYLQEIQQLAQNALHEMRSLIWQLRPEGLEQGLLTSLKRYGESLGLVVHERVEGVCALPSAVEEALWRIGQESLNNVSKHSGANQVSIRLRMTDTEVLMEIDDGGKGFVYRQTGNGMSEDGKGQSIGLIGMRERAELLGGMFKLDSRPGQGTRIEVTIPYRKPKVTSDVPITEMRSKNED